MDVFQIFWTGLKAVEKGVIILGILALVFNIRILIDILRKGDGNEDD